MLNFIGCMTGTSCDGLDIAYIETNAEEIFTFGPYCTIEFNNAEKKLLKSRLLQGEFSDSDFEISNKIALNHIKCIENFIKKHSLIPHAIGMHGQTVFHNPDAKTTIQLGNAEMVAKHFKIPVIAQFRLNDIKNGGQGAPLVPIYHLAIAKNIEKPVSFINIGGVSNITSINENNELIAFDTGTGNALIDDWMMQKTSSPYDFNGQAASSGKVDHVILNKWKNHSFFSKPFPKSLDRQNFHKFLLDIQNLSVNDGAATLSEFTIFGIQKALELLPKCKQLVICGGGVYNNYLLNKLKQIHQKVITTSEIGINPSAIEAQMIAYLAARFFKNLPSSFFHTTGVEKPTVAGKLFLP